MFSASARSISAGKRCGRHGWLRSLGSLLIVSIASISAVHAASQIEVLDTYPAGSDVTLARNQTFYVHLHYSTDRPIRIWVRPYFHGQPAHAGSSGSFTYTDSGEALGWFFMMSNLGAVDEIRVETDEHTAYGTSVLSYPVHVTGSNLDGLLEPQPEWLTRLRAREAEQQRQAHETYMRQPVSFATSALFDLFMLAMLALGVLGFILPIAALVRWRGGWRLAAAAPLALMGFVVLRLIVGVQQDPTSHNLWPFEIVMTGGLSFVVMLVLQSMRKAAGATAT
jgi:hypothetical protein